MVGGIFVFFSEKGFPTGFCLFVCLFVCFKYGEKTIAWNIEAMNETLGFVSGDFLTFYLFQHLKQIQDEKALNSFFPGKWG